MRAREDAPVRYKLDDLVIDTGTHRVTRGKDSIKLTKRSFLFLMALIRRAPNLVTNEELLEMVWKDHIVGHETITQRAKIVRDALGDDPHQPRYVAVVWGEGYRLCADVEPMPESAAPARLREQRQRTLLAGLLASAAFALTLWIGGGFPGGEDDAFDPPVASIAVMPFLNMNQNPDNDYLALGIPDSLLHRLANIDELLVIARTSSFSFGVDGLDAKHIGRELNVSYLLEGSVQQVNDDVRVVAQLINTVDASHVWSLQRRLEIDHLLDLQDEIVMEIASALKLTLLESEQQRLTERGTKNIPAYLAYLRGEHARSTNSINRLYESLEHFVAATEFDPEFARAWLSIGKVYRHLGSIGEIGPSEMRNNIESYIARALEIDPELGEAYALQAMSLDINPSVATDPARIAERDRLLDLAMSFSPNDPSVLMAYASVMCNPMEKDHSCHSRKASMLKEVIRRDPNNLEAYLSLGWTFVALDQEEYPGLLFEESIRRNPDFIPGYVDLAQWHWGSHNIDWKRSVICLCEAVERDPGNPFPLTMLASLHIDMGLPEEAAGFIGRAGEVGESPEVHKTFNRLKLHLYRGEIDEAAEFARAHLPQIGLGGYGILAFGAILESALLSGQYDEDIALLESTFESINIPVEYKDGYVRSQSAAYLAASLAKLHFVAGNTARARELVAGAKHYFEREINNGSVWRGANTWAYAAVLAQAGMTTSAVMEMELIPTSYLRNAWYLSRTPLLAELKDYSRFETIIAEIDSRIEQQRRNVASIPNRLPPCLADTMSRLPGILALTVPVRDPVQPSVSIASNR